jgi:hypothetical protein
MGGKYAGKVTNDRCKGGEQARPAITPTEKSTLQIEWVLNAKNKMIY